MASDAKCQEDEPYFSYSATLRIFGTISGLQEITDSLGLAPTHLHHPGEVRAPGAKPYEHDLWAYEPPMEESQPLHVHIDALWRAIRPHKDYLIHLKDPSAHKLFRDDSEVHRGGVSKSEIARLQISRSSVRRILANHRQERTA